MLTRHETLQLITDLHTWADQLDTAARRLADAKHCGVVEAMLLRQARELRDMAERHARRARQALVV